jgi:hypothetical protein
MLQLKRRNVSALNRRDGESHYWILNANVASRLISPLRLGHWFGTGAACRLYLQMRDELRLARHRPVSG